MNATNFNFSAETLAALGVERAAAAIALVEVLRADPRFAAAFTREEIESQRFDPADRAARALYASLYPGRSGDVLFALREGWLQGAMPPRTARRITAIRTCRS